MNRKFSAEGYRLRAEELRAIASEITREEYRRFLFGVALDYERMAESAEFISECRDRLELVTESLDRSQDVAVPASEIGADRTGDHSIQSCRMLAGDAGRLGSYAEGASREAWNQLAKHWSSLADRLEEADRSR